MAEKEERILVLKATEDDFIYKHFNGNGFVPRAEVVERMAKAICREDNQLDSCLQCVIGFGQTPEMKEKFCKQILRKTKKLDASYIHRAEAALNALLDD